MPKISVIIPTFKAEKFLNRTIKSLQSQTFMDWQAIFVIDKSPDKSAEILGKFAESDSRIIVQELDKNMGPGNARNVGLDMASGEYIMFCDTDDLLHPQTMEIALNLATQNNSDIITFRYNHAFRTQIRLMRIFGMDTDNILPYDFNQKYNVKKIKSCITNMPVLHITENRDTDLANPIIMAQAWKFLIRRDFLISNKIRFPNLYTYEDVPWLIRLMTKNPKTVITQIPLYYYYLNKRSLLHTTKRVKQVSDLLTVINVIYDEIKNISDEHVRESLKREYLCEFVKMAKRHIKRLPKSEQKTPLIKLGIVDKTY